MRRGVALPVTLLALTLSTVLAVTALWVARRAVATDRDAARGDDLRDEAERTLLDAVARWDSAARAAQPTGTVRGVATTDGPGVRTDAWITRTSERMYWLVAESRSTTLPLLRVRLGLVVRAQQAAAVPVPQRAWMELP